MPRMHIIYLFITPITLYGCLYPQGSKPQLRLGYIGIEGIPKKRIFPILPIIIFNPLKICQNLWSRILYYLHTCIHTYTQMIRDKNRHRKRNELKKPKIKLWYIMFYGFQFFLSFSFLFVIYLYQVLNMLYTYIKSRSSVIRWRM